MIKHHEHHETELDKKEKIAEEHRENKKDCEITIGLNRKNIDLLKTILTHPHYSKAIHSIIVINISAETGIEVANDLFPDKNWGEPQKKAEKEYIVAIAERDKLCELILEFDAEAAMKLDSKPYSLSIVVLDYGVAEVFFE